MPIERQPLPAVRFVRQAPDPAVVQAQPGAVQFWRTNYVIGGGGGGVTDHGALTGLGDDDHPQYLLVTEGNALYAALVHSHAQADVTGLVAALAAKLNSSAVSAFGLTLIDDADAAAARATLGLGSLATLSSLAASAVTNTPAGGIAAADVQAALNELDGDKYDKTGGTVTGDITMSRNGAGAAASMHITGDAGQLRRLFLETGGLTRWELRCDNAAESGANAGSNFRLIRFDDAGVVIDVPLIVNRSTGAWTIAGATTFQSNLTVTGNLVVNGTTITANSTTVTFDDIIVVIGGDTAPVADDGLDRGFEFRWHDGAAAKLGFIGWDRSANEFVLIPDATDTANVITGTAGTLKANLNGNANTATAWATGRTITTTGDVTGTSGAFNGTANLSFALTIAANAVTNAQLADMATARIKGRITAGSGDPEDLTGTQATTLLDTFTNALKGLAPASGGGTSNFLRADGTWASPSAGAAGTMATVEVDFTTPAPAKTFVVAVTGVAAGQPLVAQVSAQMPAGVAVDELEMDPLTVAAWASAADQVTLVVAAANQSYIFGKRNINIFRL